MKPARWGAAMALLALVTAGYSTAQGAPLREPEVRSAPAPATTALRHVLVMSQEGHSFDNYLGHRPDVDGLPGGTCLPSAPKDAVACVRPHPISGSPHAVLRDTAAAQKASVDRGKMDGFVRAQAVHGSDGNVAMGYYPANRVPVITGLADRGTVFDQWFTAVPGTRVANDLFAVAATAPTDVARVPAQGWRNIPLIFDRLQAAGVSWRIYVENYQPSVTLRAASARQRAVGQLARVPVLATPRFLANPALASHVADLRRYYDDLARDRLPAVSFIISTQHTERAPRNPAIDQQLVRGVVNGLLASSAWHDSAFFLTYSTSGGWYDHVPPRTIDGEGTGLRVPTVLLSPYVQAGTVDHTSYDSAAILKLIEQNWSLAPLTSRDRTAPSLLPRFSFEAGDLRPALVDVKPTRPPAQQPNRAILYLGYVAALLAAGICVAFVLYTRRGRARVRSR